MPCEVCCPDTTLDAGRLRCHRHAWVCPDCGAQGNITATCWECRATPTPDVRQGQTQRIVTEREWQEYLSARANP